MLKTLFVLFIQCCALLVFSQKPTKSTFLSINPGVVIYDDDGLLARNEIELGHSFHRFFSASAILGYETNLTDKNSFVGSGYDVSANGYFTPLNQQKKTALKIGGGIGFGKYTRAVYRFGSLNGNEMQFYMPIQKQTQGVIAKITLEATRKLTSKFEIGAKYTYRIFDYDSQIPVLLKLQINL